jgi:CubicO group peptidase (beta-lactamase class C family)
MLVVSPRASLAQDALPAEAIARIDGAAAEVLASTGAPSASIAVVKDGRIVYAHAYGFARLDPKTPATTAMRYSIGSVSKQFTSSALLLLVQEHKLTLDDPVSRWLPDLTRAREVTVRNLLSMTSGYQDYWPQDYVMPPMLQPTTATDILQTWARKPLDFDPGTRWQYSNTNYVIAGLIVERITGTPLLKFLTERFFEPLGMTTVSDIDSAPLGPAEPERYRRFALGPPRPAPKEGKGWLFAAGELAMTAEDLARWDISMIDRRVLAPASYDVLEHEVQLENGVGTRYGLGVSVGMANGRRFVSHSGEVSGFTTHNDVYPDDRVAIVVYTNLDATDASGQIASKIADVVFGLQDARSAAALTEARAIVMGLQDGRIDRTRLTDNLNAYFSDQALADFRDSLKPLGPPREVTEQGHSLRGGMVFRRFRIRFDTKTLSMTTFTMPDGRLEQCLVEPAE